MNNLHVIKLVQVRISGICVCECVYFFFLFIAFTEFVFTSSIKSEYFDIVWWYFGMQFLSYKCMSMTVWTGVNTLKPQTVIGRGLNDDWYCTHTHTHTTCCCLQLIRDLSTREDSRTHTCTHQGVCSLWNWSRCWPDIIYRWTHSQTDPPSSVIHTLCASTWDPKEAGVQHSFFKKKKNSAELHPATTDVTHIIHYV